MSDAARWALVAGGSGGIGSAICQALAEDGWSVALTYRRNRAAAEHVATQVKHLGREAVTVHVDLADTAATADIVSGSTPVPLSGVVYAAGPFIPMRYVSQLSPERYREQLVNDAVAAYNVLQPAIAQLRQTSGCMVALTTPAVDHHAKKDVFSSSPKAAVAAVVRGIAAEEGRHGVRANCVGVGLIEGEGMWKELINRGDYSEQLLSVARENLALRRFGNVADIAAATQFLMSSRASWITGQTLCVDGGYAI